MTSRGDLERIGSTLSKIKNPNPVEAERREKGAEERERLTRKEVKSARDVHRSHFDMNFGEYIKVNKKTGESRTRNWMPKINLPKLNLPSINIPVRHKGTPKSIYLDGKGGRLSSSKSNRRKKKLYKSR